MIKPKPKTNETSKKKNLIVYGIGHKTVNLIYNKFGLNLRTKNIIVKPNHQKMIKKQIRFFSYSETLKVKTIRAINHYIKIKNYKGTRHLYKYPVRGQRTHTNAKTQKRLHQKILK